LILGLLKNTLFDELMLGSEQMAEGGLMHLFVTQ
jgi:hypothetical protein